MGTRGIFNPRGAYELETEALSLLTERQGFLFTEVVVVETSRDPFNTKEIEALLGQLNRLSER
jgi:hypothetical protein